jgi:predicted esterase
MVGAKRDPKAPAVVFVHGAGYAQNAHKYWSTYYREYMFHHVLASKGTSCSIPTIARAPATAATGGPRSIAGWAATISTTSSMAPRISSGAEGERRRIGVYGGSYGGFITLMALFTSPDTFAAARRSGR